MNSDELASLRHILTVYNQFYNMIVEDTEKMRVEEVHDLEEERIEKQQVLDEQEEAKKIEVIKEAYAEQEEDSPDKK